MIDYTILRKYTPVFRLIFAPLTIILSLKKQKVVHFRTNDKYRCIDT